jgi:hypothetical protein
LTIGQHFPASPLLYNVPPHRNRNALLILIALGAIDRAVTLFVFGFRYTSFDDAIFWQGARDYAQGIFHWPYVYGQDYNPMLESMLAVPGVWLGVPYAILMSLVTSLLALLPFWSFAIWHHRRGDGAAALWLAATPLLLPIEHGMMTTMTRGFVTGIAVLSLFPWSSSISRHHFRCIAGGAVLALALFVNPSAAVLAVPLGVHALLTERRRGASIAWMTTGALPFLSLWWVCDRYCSAHPERMVHKLYDWRMAFHPELIREHFDRLNEHFAWLCPLLWSHGVMVLILVTLCCVLLFVRRRWTAALALLSALLVVFASFAFAKTQDGSMNVLMPLSRMYLAMPLLLGWSMAMALPGASPRSWIVRAGVAVTLCFMIARTVQLPGAIERMISERASAPVGEFPVADLRTDAKVLGEWAHRTGAGLVLWSRTPRHQEAITGAYASELLEPDLPPSLLINYDRRYWRVEEERTRVADVVLFVGGDAAAWSTTDLNVRTLGTLPTSRLEVHVIRNGGMPALELVAHLRTEH